MSSHRLTRRGVRALGIVLLSSIGLLIYLHRYDVLLLQRIESPPPPPPLYNETDPGLPPLYETVRAKEQSLPHYDEYEHGSVKYLYAANHARNSGWGNVMQDFVMMALLAHDANRSFVFNDYVWNADGSIYSEYNGKNIPSRTPLSALLGGPMVGGPWPPGDVAPLSVSKEFFHKVCPNPTVLQVSDINTDEIRLDDDLPSAEIFEKWVEKINSIQDPCLMLDRSSDPIFEYWMFGRKRMLSVWPYLGKSPVVTHWGWSSLVRDAYKRNRHLFEPTKTSLFDWIWSPWRNKSVFIPGLLVIHVRRGDFKDHCVGLASWSSDWHAFNSFPEFPDKLDKPTDAEANLELYMRRCYPSVEEIVERVRQVRVEAADPLRYLYIMTNGPVPWVKELKTAIEQDMSWDHVGSSRDLGLTWEEKFVSQGLDMFIAQQAQVFIGNGWSSLTSNVVMLRMAQGSEPDTNRFW